MQNFDSKSPQLYFGISHNLTLVSSGQRSSRMSRSLGLLFMQLHMPSIRPIPNPSTCYSYMQYPSFLMSINFETVCDGCHQSLILQSLQLRWVPSVTYFTVSLSLCLSLAFFANAASNCALCYCTAELLFMAWVLIICSSSPPCPSWKTFFFSETVNHICEKVPIHHISRLFFFKTVHCWYFFFFFIHMGHTGGNFQNDIQGPWTSCDNFVFWKWVVVDRN